jgi:hypothetical protein
MVSALGCRNAKRTRSTTKVDQRFTVACNWEPALKPLPSVENQSIPVDEGGLITENPDQ